MRLPPVLFGSFLKKLFPVPGEETTTVTVAFVDPMEASVSHGLPGHASLNAPDTHVLTSDKLWFYYTIF